MRTSAASTRTRLLQVHKRLHRELKREAEALLGAPSREILAYARGLRQEFSHVQRQLADTSLGNSIIRKRILDSSSGLISNLRRSEVTLIGDFHPFHQSQRTALRLLRSSFAAEDSLTWLGLELVSSRYQSELDAFQKKQLTLPEFLQAIRYRDEWGFPWKNYEPLFDWARETGVRLIGLNLPRELRPSAEWLSLAGARAGSGDLLKRDRWAAGIITDLFAEARAEDSKKSARMVVLYGELHLASNRLPHELERISRQHLSEPLETLAIHQNHDETWWRLAERGLLDEARVARISPRSWCVFTAPPWSKTQALLRHTEEGNARSDIALGARAIPSHPRDDLEWEESELELEEPQFDPLGEVARWHALLASFLELEPKDLSSLTLYGLDDIERFTSRELAARIDSRDLSLMRKMVRWKLRFLDRKTRIAWLPELSENALAETAAIALLDDQLISTQGQDPFERLFLIPLFEYAFGFLGSLILNPRRKCELPGDHRQRLRELDKRKPEMFRGERLAREISARLGDITPSGVSRAVTLARAVAQAQGRSAARLKNDERTRLLRLSARWSGRILAARLHLLLAQGKLPTEELLKLFAADLGGTEKSGTARLEHLTRICDITQEAQLPRTKSAWF
jgi:hypothetical protein